MKIRVFSYKHPERAADHERRDSTLFLPLALRLLVLIVFLALLRLLADLIVGRVSPGGSGCFGSSPWGERTDGAFRRHPDGSARAPGWLERV